MNPACLLKVHSAVIDRHLLPARCSAANLQQRRASNGTDGQTTDRYTDLLHTLHGQCHTHTHLFNGPLSRTTQVSWYRKGKTNLDFTEARDSQWQWHQLGRVQVCTWLQTDNHASTPLLSFITGRMPFMPPNQQHQSTEGKYMGSVNNALSYIFVVSSEMTEVVASGGETVVRDNSTMAFHVVD